MRLAARDLGLFQQTQAASIAWEDSACLLCGSEDWTPFLEALDPHSSVGELCFLIVKCRLCGLCFTNPRPNFDSMRQFYAPDYPCHQSKPPRTREHFWKSDPMRRLLPLQGQRRLLDFGCGAGDFLQRMHELGWHVIGLDSAAPVVQDLHRHGVTMHNGTLPQPRWADASFEAITMWQALEHVHQPLEVLRDAFRLLTPGGRLLVTVPNLESLSFSWFGSNWYGLDLPRHLTHFTADTLRGMLQRAGFEHIAIRQEQRSSWIRHSARLVQQRRAGGFLGKWLQTRLGSGLAGRAARWSGQAESLLAQAIKPGAASREC